MPTLVKDPQPVEIEQLIERRRQLGIDRYDEVWDGTYVMSPAPRPEHQDLVQRVSVLFDPLARAVGLKPNPGVNVGVKTDFRVPDVTLRRPDDDSVYLPTVALAVEILSPNDDTPQKIPFYAAHGVDELVIVDPAERSVRWLALHGDEYQEVQRSGLIELGPAELAAAIDWPPTLCH